MMTIKEFAILCGCNAQTLRYYDRIDLLKPVKVDQWSGYRYYTKSQAIDFVKIKNLQAADFTIDEIKALLPMPDQRVYEAFDRKIAQQMQKLERIREIQQSYLTEKKQMEKLVQNAVDYILHAVKDYEVLREFGLNPAEGAAIVEKLKAYMEENTRRNLPAEPDVQLIVDDRVIRGADQIADAFEELKGAGYDHTVLLGDEAVREDAGFTPQNSETVWECHGWQYVREFLDDIPAMEQGYDYCFSFKLAQDKYRDGLEFPMFMIAAMMPRAAGTSISMGCNVERSEDAENHFILLRKKNA